MSIIEKAKAKEKLLFIDLQYHKKTKSVDFILDLLEKYFEVTKLYLSFNYFSENSKELYEIYQTQYRYLVCFQVDVPWGLLGNLHYEKAVFFPMYDQESVRKKELWEKYREFTIINFSQTLHDKLSGWGYNSKYIQYFPLVEEKIQWGNDKGLFFWQRIEHIDNELIRKICSNIEIDKIHLHKSLDPGQKGEDSGKFENVKIERSEWFETREEMQQCVQESAYYFAPRIAEGIGMSFLEAMAMGRCVIAHNDATMNEYIEHGETGFIYDYTNPIPINCSNVKEIQEKAYAFMKKGRKKWENECLNIIDWIREAKNIVDYEVKYDILAYKNASYFHLLNQWVKLKIQGGSLIDFFEQHGYARIAIYGGGEICDRLIEEVVESKIDIVGIIDKNEIANKYEIPVFKLEDEIPEADAIIITPIWAYWDIYKDLAIRELPVIPLTEIIREELEDYK